MLEPGVMNDTPKVIPGDGVNGHNGHNGHADGAALEQRVRHLEDAVSQLQDTEQLEERVATRVTERVSRNIPVAVAPPPEPPGFFARLPRALLPTTVTTIDPHADGRTAPEGNRGVRAFFDVLAEMRAVWRMYVDPRYRLTWMARLVAPVLLVAIITSWIWLPGAFLLATVSNMLATVYVKAADLVLAFFLYKALSREARRYRDAFPENPPRPSA